jgi:putative endonuclease
MYFTYVLKSKNGKYYIGYTSDVSERLKRHNSKKVTATKNFVPWQLFYKEEFVYEREAIRRERQLKSWKSRKALERLKFK